MTKKYDDFDLLRYLRKLELSTFTITEVTNQLMLGDKVSFVDKKNARQFVYRRIRELCISGQIKKVSSNKAKVGIYTLSELANPHLGDAMFPSTCLEFNEVQSFELTLISKIKECKSEMLACIGEAEAINEWSEIVVTLPEEMKEKYRNSRERSAILLGKLNTFESMLEHYQG